MKLRILSIALLVIFHISCNRSKQSNSSKTVTENFQNKGHELIHDMIQKTGSYSDLIEKRDVVYTYAYMTPDGKTDISTEKYMFDGELSLGIYHKHERTLPELEDSIIQGYDGKHFWLKHKGTFLQDDKQLKRVKFNRKTNFYWFAMFQKLLDAGLKYEYLGEDLLANQKYDIVKVTFDSTNNEPTDIYQLYINQDTKLVDQFLFTVVDFGVIENPMLMKLEYEKVDGFLIPSKREYKKSTWDAQVSEEPWIKVLWSDIKFDSGLKKEEFEQEKPVN